MRSRLTGIAVASALTVLCGPRSAMLHAAQDAGRDALVQAARLPPDMLPLPIIRQATTYSCGAASLLSILYYWQVFDGPESKLYKILDTTPKDGTEPAKIVEGARSFGLKAHSQENTSVEDLRQALREGETAILDIQAWRTPGAKVLPWRDTWEEGHYVVLAGLDPRYAYFMDPAAGPGYAYLPLSEFVDRWHDYEDRHGPRHDYHHLAIFIRGKRHLESVPGPLIRMQ